MSTTAVARTIQTRSDFAGILRVEERFAKGTDDNIGERMNGWFDRLVIQSGIDGSPSVLLMLCLLSAIAVGGAVFVITEGFISTALAGSLGALIPLAVAMVTRARRQMQMLRQMPDMVGELSRAARTGRSLQHCFQTVAANTKGALGDELKLAARRLEMGADMASATRELPERTGLVSMNVFTTALAVHEQMGGDLVGVLERLSQTIRDRIAFLGRLRAATIGSRATAVLMIALPPMILTFFVIRDPDYFSDLLSSFWGRFATVAAIVLQIIGTFWVLRIMKGSKRT